MDEKWLTIIDMDGNMKEWNLSEFHEGQLKIGRDAGQCDIIIRDSVVSKWHGTIWLEEGRVLYCDEDSMNGTFLSIGSRRRLLDKKVGFVELFDNAVLRIGNPDNPWNMVLLLFAFEGKKERWKCKNLTTETVTVGRAESNQICLHHPGISKMHCRILRKDEEYILEDLNSTNGLMVNGVATEGGYSLREKDIIQILGYQLLFSQGCIYYKEETKGVSLRIRGVSKIVGRGHSQKKILDHVSCDIQGNEFVAIIGGSGAGKTTLMNAISGYEPDFTGKVYCNGVNLTENFKNLKNIIGFVPQQDIIYENLTLKKMLYYSAKIRMSKDVSLQEIENRVNEVLDMVDLKEHQNTYIRKLSGGQKKRASIAVELLADPKLFFLDEPTSGLDPGTEKSLMLNLKKLSREKNKTVIMVTHTTANLQLCDKIIFMGPGGRLCFCGSVEKAMRFYGTNNLVNIYNLIAESPAFWQKRYWSLNQKEEENEDKEEAGECTGKRKDSAFRQFWILAQRYTELMLNDKPRLAVLLLQPCFIAVLLHIVADKDIFKIYENTKTILFALSCSGIWIGLFDSIQEICKERPIVKREYMANLRLTGYVLSKFLFQTVLGGVQAFLLTMIFLKLSGAERKGIFLNNFTSEILLTVWLTILASIAFGLLISSVVKNGDKAMTAAPFVLIIQLLFSGILFSLKGLGKEISYCTVSRWSVEALGSIAKLNKLDLKMQKDYPMLEHAAEDFFKATRSHVLSAWGILLFMTALLLAASVISLRRVARDRR